MNTDNILETKAHFVDIAVREPEENSCGLVNGKGKPINKIHAISLYPCEALDNFLNSREVIHRDRHGDMQIVGIKYWEHRYGQYIYGDCRPLAIEVFLQNIGDLRRSREHVCGMLTSARDFLVQDSKEPNVYRNISEEEFFKRFGKATDIVLDIEKMFTRQQENPSLLQRGLKLLTGDTNNGNTKSQQKIA